MRVMFRGFLICLLSVLFVCFEFFVVWLVLGQLWCWLVSWCRVCLVLLMMILLGIDSIRLSGRLNFFRVMLLWLWVGFLLISFGVCWWICLVQLLVLLMQLQIGLLRVVVQLILKVVLLFGLVLWKKFRLVSIVLVCLIRLMLVWQIQVVCLCGLVSCFGSVLFSGQRFLKLQCVYSVLSVLLWVMVLVWNILGLVRQSFCGLVVVCIFGRLLSRVLVGSSRVVRCRKV